MGKVLLVKKKNSSRGEYDFAPCSPRRTSVCLHTTIVTLDNHCYIAALYIISMIYLCHYDGTAKIDDPDDETSEGNISDDEVSVF